jgi:hypothetical protein
MALPYPVIVFNVNLSIPNTEAFGPLTNETLQGTDSPDNIIDSANQTLINALKAARPDARSTCCPSEYQVTYSSLIADNPNNVKHGKYIVLYGSKALEVLKTRCSQATIQTYLPSYTGPGAPPGCDVLSVVYFGNDPT